MDIAEIPCNPVAMLFYNGVHDPTPNRCGGSGPAQLALALLSDHFQELPEGDERALERYQAFKWHVVSKLFPEWTLTRADIDQALREIKVGVR